MSGDRKIYLSDVALDVALTTWHAALDARGLLGPLGRERIALQAAAGRVTAESVWARISSPHYHACAMDGYAVRSEETNGATETAPLILTIGSQAHPVEFLHKIQSNRRMCYLFFTKFTLNFYYETIADFIKPGHNNQQPYSTATRCFYNACYFWRGNGH